MSSGGGDEVRPPALAAGATASAAASEDDSAAAVDASTDEKETSTAFDGLGTAAAATSPSPSPGATRAAKVESTVKISTWPRGRVVLADAATAATDATMAKDGVEVVKIVKEILEKHPMPSDEAMDAVRSNGSEIGASSAFSKAIAHSDNRHIARAWAEVFADALSPRKMADVCTEGFAVASVAAVASATSAAAATIDADAADAQNTTRMFLTGLSVFFAYGARIEARDLIELAAVLTLEQLKDCFVGGLSCVDNPFIPGVSLSVVLEDALKNAPESEKPVLTALHEQLDDLLLEVLERLPQKMEDIPGGVAACQSIFEPEAAGLRERNFPGPLRLAVQERQFSETLCVSPLVFEYMSHRFVAGLPNIYDTNNLLGRRRRRTDGGPKKGSASGMRSSEYRGRKGRDFLYTEGFVASSTLGRVMQGLGWAGKTDLERPSDWERVLSGTVLPGAQFVTIGLLTNPLAYYKVPAMRMVLGFYVHLIMLFLYTVVVLEDDDGQLSKTEIFLTFHVMAEIVSNLLQMWANFFEYFQNKWNWLECLSLSLLAGGLFIRVDDSDVYQGRALFALSAPLVFSRVLFFGQVLQRQGVVIQMMAIMFGEMFHFGLVLGTIMMGFTVSFFAIFGEYESYGGVWLSVFKAMLGEVNAFDVLYEESPYKDVARLLLVLYLIVVAVMLLNLLIAVLSTEHAKVERQQDRAFRESKVRIMKLYTRQVDADLVPSPFNLVQLALWLMASAVDGLFRLRTCPKIMQDFGVGVFWCMLGPPALLIAWGLWLASIPAAVLKVCRRTTFSGRSLTFAVVCSSAVVALHAFGLPVAVVWFWLRSGWGLFVSMLGELLAALCGNGGDDGGDPDESEDSLPLRDRLRYTDPGDPPALATAGIVRAPTAAAAAAVASPTTAPVSTVPSSRYAAAAASARASFSSAFGPGSPAPPFVSVANILEGMHSSRGTSKKGGDGLNSVAKIWAYLDDPATTTGLDRRQQEKDQTATRDHIVQMRNLLDTAGKEQGDAILARLASVDAEITAKIVRLERSVARSVEDLLDSRIRLEESVGALVQEQVARTVEKGLVPLREKLTEGSSL
ncbi:unnamed protein product [Scytosiphon promiscuus]